ncbi:hypothetical protein JCM24511_08113 [Saitozyma sp. JCM 24511]|nr:hypothetical protein JCM24511_08113 [Saitozyma sp. JCM 24511]
MAVSAAPIEVRDMIYRLVTKAIIRHSNRRDFLLPYQIGVGSKGGVEPVVRGVERALEGTLDQPYTHLTSLDFSNAFNTVDRKDNSGGTPLVLSSPEGRHIITSAQGVRQGDPMGPLMFSFGIRSLLRDLAANLGPDRLILAYLDDIYILSPDSALEQTLAFFDERQPSIRLNPTKCKMLALEDVRTDSLRMLEQAKAVVEASSKLGRVWLTTIPFQPSLRLTDFEIAAALQLRTLAGGQAAYSTNCGEANFFGHPEVCLQRKPWRVARHEGPKRIIGQALDSTPGTRVRLEPLGHTSRRNDIQVITLLGSQTTGLANAEYDFTVVSLASKDSRATSLPEQTKTRPGWSTSTSTLLPTRETGSRGS